MFELGLTDRSWSQHGWILAKVLFICILMDQVHCKSQLSKNTKKNKAIIQPSWPNKHGQFAICTPRIIHLVCPPKFCTSILFNFFWDHWNTQGESKTKVMQKFGGQTRCILWDLQMANKRFMPKRELFLVGPRQQILSEQDFPSFHCFLSFTAYIMYMLWFNFILAIGLNFTSFCFILIHYCPYPPPSPPKRVIKLKPRIKLDHNIYILLSLLI